LTPTLCAGRRLFNAAFCVVALVPPWPIFKVPFEIVEALTLIPVAFATIPEPALILIAILFAVTIELDRLMLPAKASNVLVVLPKALPFAVGIKSPLIDVLLHVRLPLMVKSLLTVRVCLTMA